MDKIKSFAPLAALSLLFGKGMLTSFDVYNTTALLILSALFGFLEYKLQKNDITLLSDEIKKLNARCDASDKKVSEVNNHVGGMKMAQQMRPQANR